MLAGLIARPVTVSATTYGKGQTLATSLSKELRRQVSVDGVSYTIMIDADGLRLTGKGKRKPEVELRWRELLNGDAAMAVALNASLGPAVRPSAPEASKPVSKTAPKKVRRG